MKKVNKSFTMIYRRTMSFVFPELDTTNVTGTGFVTRQTVKVASTANVDLTTNLTGATVDGVTLSVNDRILLKNQTTTLQNGIYIVGSGANTSFRADDYDVGRGGAGTQVTVQQGTTLADTIWLCTNDTGNDVIGTNSLVFSQIAGFSTNQLIDHSTVSILPGTGLTGGGDITATRTLSLNINGLATEATPTSGDFVPIYHLSNTTQEKITLGQILSSSATNAIISLSNTASITGITTSAVNLTWNTENRVDSRYTHSTVTNSENVTFNIAGTYFVTLNVGTDVSAGGSRTLTNVYLQLNTGAGFGTIANTQATIYNRTTGAGLGSCAIEVAITVAATNILRAQVLTVVGTNTIVTTPAACRLTIVSV